MRRCAAFYLLLSCVALLLGCGPNYYVEPPKPPSTYKAVKGLAQYECEAFSWINTACGPVELDNVWVTSGIMTDKVLRADCSNIAGLCIGGKAWLHHSIVRGTSSIGDRAAFYDSEVRGELSVGNVLVADGSVFHMPVHVCGNIEAKCSCFQSTIEATAEILCFDNTETGTIYIHATGPYYDPQVVKLAHGSVVHGDIYFESCRGKVVMDSSSCITGEIYGGHVIEPFACYVDPFYEAFD